MRRVATSWKLIEEVLYEHAHSVYKALRAPVTERALSRLRDALPAPLPPTFAESLAIHDGVRASAGGNPLINYYDLVPASQIVSWRRMQLELQEECEFAGDALTTTPAIRNDRRWRAGWVPVLLHNLSDAIVLDLDPGPQGKAGQLFYWYNNGCTAMRVIAPSWAAFLDRLAEELHARRFTLDQFGGIQMRGTFLDFE